jgi:hypothetical protein
MKGLALICLLITGIFILFFAGIRMLFVLKQYPDGRRDGIIELAGLHGPDEHSQKKYSYNYTYNDENNDYQHVR